MSFLGANFEVDVKYFDVATDTTKFSTYEVKAKTREEAQAKALAAAARNRQANAVIHSTTELRKKT